jgi:hypothetical protein
LSQTRKRHKLLSMAHSELSVSKRNAEGVRGMTSLRLFETDGALIAEDATSHPFERPPRSERHRRSRWPYDISVVLHAIALVSLVSLARSLTPPPRPMPAPLTRNLTSAVALTTFGVDGSRHRRPSNIRHSRRLPVAIMGNVGAAPVPPARGDSRVADTRSKPLRSALDPPILVGDALLKGRRVDPSEAGLGSATVNVGGSPTAEIRPGGLGEGSFRDLRNGGSMFTVRPGFDDDSAGGGGATPPRIQESLPIPDDPADAQHLGCTSLCSK